MAIVEMLVIRGKLSSCSFSKGYAMSPDSSWDPSKTEAIWKWMAENEQEGLEVKCVDDLTGPGIVS